MTTDATIACGADALSPTALTWTLANLASVFGGEGLLRLGSFFATVVIARSYGSAVLGIYATAVAYATVVSMLADNGLQTAALQHISRSPADAAAIASRIYVAKTLLLVPAVLLLIAVAVLFRLPALVIRIAMLVALRTLLQSYAQLHAALLKAISHMQALAVVQALHFMFLIAGLFWCYRGGYGISVLLTVMVGGQVLELLGSALALRNFGLRAFRVTLTQCWNLVCKATPMGATYTLASMALRCDVVVLSWTAPRALLGHFAAAQSFLVLLSVGSWLFGSVLLPEMSRLAHDDEAVQYYVARWTRRLAMVLIPSTILALWTAPAAVRAVFGEPFAAAAGLITILVLATPFVFWNALYLNRAVALDLRSVYLGSYAAAFLFGLLLDFALVHSWSATGIAVGAVAREVLMFTLFRASSGWRRVTA